MPLTVTPIFRISQKKIMLPLLIQKKIEAYALIQSVAFIRVLLLFGGLPPFLASFSGSSPLYRTPHRE